MTKINQLIDIENQLKSVSMATKQKWKVIGEHLYKVQNLKLIESSDTYSSFSAWLAVLSKEIDIRPSTLWSYLRVFSLVEKLNIELDELTAPISGLDKIVSIYNFEKDQIKAEERVNQLNKKQTSLAKLTEEFKSLKMVKENIATVQPILTPKLTSNTTSGISSRIAKASCYCLLFVITIFAGEPIY